MKLISLKCPDCGANLEIEQDRSFCFCSYCGHKIIIDDEVERSESTYIIRDEARIREAEAEIKEIELEREWQDNRKKSIKRWAKICLSALVLGTIIILIGSWIEGIDDVLELGNSKYFWIGMIFLDIGLVGFTYGGFGYFISMLSHNRQRRKRRKR